MCSYFISFHLYRKSKNRNQFTCDYPDNSPLMGHIRSSCALNSCTSNPSKLHLWNNSMCEFHREVHDHCPCLIPFKMHIVSTDEHSTLEWINAIHMTIMSPNI